MTGIPLRFVTTNQGKLDFLRNLVRHEDDGDGLTKLLKYRG